MHSLKHLRAHVTDLNFGFAKPQWLTRLISAFRLVPWFWPGIGIWRFFGALVSEQKFRLFYMYFSCLKGTVCVVAGIRIQYSDICDREDASCYTISRFRIWSWVDVSAASAALPYNPFLSGLRPRPSAWDVLAMPCTTQTNKDKFLPEIADQKLWRPTCEGLTGTIGVKVLPRAPTLCHQAGSGVLDSYLVQQGPAPGQAGATFTKL